MELTPEILSNTAKVCAENNPGNKIAAIKDLRTALGQISGTSVPVLGLLDAKELIEAHTNPGLGIARMVLKGFQTRAYLAQFDRSVAPAITLAALASAT